MARQSKKRQVDNLPALFDLTPYTTEPAGEYIPDPSWDRFDSVADDSVADSKALATESNPEVESPATESNPEVESPATESTGWLSTYSPAGTARSETEYYRYNWRAGKRVHHVHIRGGNTGNPIAQQRAQKVREAIARGEQPREIVNKFLKN